MTTSIRPDILTVSGHYFDFLDPTHNVVQVTDIAHALSQVCRFAGHTREFYSVAQHSVLVSDIVSPENALIALFHDAVEAYIGDVTRPLKNLLPEYRVIEARLQADIFRKLGLPEQIPAEVKHADLILLATEQRDLMPEHDDEWSLIAHVDPLPDSIVAWSPDEAEEYFLDRYWELTDPDGPARIPLDRQTKPASTKYADMALCSSPLSYDEAVRMEAELMPLLRYLGSPGDWGYGTKLGRLTEVLHGLRGEIRQSGKAAAALETKDQDGAA
jgi:hypothetical protein